MKKAHSALMPLFLVSLLSMGAARAQSHSAPGPDGGSREAGSGPAAAAALQAPERPQPPGLGKQILGGTAFGAGGMLAGGAAGAGLLAGACALWGEDCGFAGLGGAFLGGILGFSGGFPYGVYRFGTDGNYPGSLGWTYASALMGSAAGFGGWALATRLKDEDAWFQSAMLGLAGAPIGALIGFNLTRGQREGIPQVSLVPMPGGGWAGRMTWAFK